MAFSILWPDGHAFDTPLPEKDQINFWKTKLVYPYEADTLAIVHKDILTANDNQHFTL